MIDVDFQITIQCLWCKKKLDEEDSITYCNGCDDNHAYKTVENAIKEGWKNYNLILDDEGLKNFKSQSEKDLYIRSYQSGYKDALFWTAMFLGDQGQEFFENLLGDEWS